MDKSSLGSALHAEVETRGLSKRLSERLWNLRWEDLLPLQLTADGVTAEWSSLDEAQPFIEAHYPTIFEETGTRRFRTRTSTEAKLQYFREFGDFIEFRHEQRTVGLLIGNPQDWSTYYFRSIALIKEYRGRGILESIVSWMCTQLQAAGVERAEGNTSPVNAVMVHLLNRLGFRVTGNTLDDRWGAMMQLTKFLDEESEAIFFRQFCVGVKYKPQITNQRKEGLQ